MLYLWFSLASQPHSVPQRQSDRFQHPPADTDMYIYIDMEKVQMKDKTQKQKKKVEENRECRTDHVINHHIHTLNRVGLES